MKEYLKSRKIKILGLYIVSRIVFGSIIILLGSSLTEVCKIWDNEHYIAIAQNGYTKEYQTAFFPVIPLIIHFCTEKGLWIINQIAFLESMFLLDELTKREDLYIVETFAVGCEPVLLCLGRAEIYAAHARLHRAGLWFRPAD